MSLFPTAVAFGHTLAAVARERGRGQECPRHTTPEGASGNAGASRAWKGNGWLGPALLSPFQSIENPTEMASTQSL
jgi:hypothetical protein